MGDLRPCLCHLGLFQVISSGICDCALCIPTVVLDIEYTYDILWREQNTPVSNKGGRAIKKIQTFGRNHPVISHSCISFIP